MRFRARRGLMAGVFFVAFFAALGVQAEGADEVTVWVDEIVKNRMIRGAVVGLSEAERTTHKIVIYVKIDQWYVHPHAGGREGESFAAIRRDGTWEIPTVARRARAFRLAVLVVKRSASMPATVKSLEELEGVVGRFERDLRGTVDYGKL